MDPDPPSSTPRKVKFAPKAPPRRTPKQITTNIEAAAENDGDDEETQQSLSRRVNEHLSRRGPKVEKKSSVQVAFSHGVASTALRTFGKQRERTDNRSDAADSKESPPDNRQNLVASIPAAGTQGVDEIVEDLTDTVTVKKKKKEYKEPWDYNSYYPVTLPLRKPHSGDPELLDKAEFGEPQEYDENTLSSASDLGLLDQDDTPRMLFFQFPSSLPLGTRETADSSKALEKPATNQKETTSSSLPSAASKGKGIAGSTPRASGISTGTKGKEKAGSSKNPVSGHSSKKCCRLEEFPEGYMGKLLVYRSGSVKLKLGNILYDVSPGSDFACPQSVMAINTTNKHCCEVGQLSKRAVVSPDIDSMLDDVIHLG